MATENLQCIGSLIFFWKMVDKSQTFLFGYISLCNCPLAGPNSLIIHVRAGQALGEAALGGSISAPHPEVLQTSLCTAHHAVSARKAHLSVHPQLHLPCFLNAGL